jgi:proteasome lid subunit RPN8/RPN11
MADEAARLSIPRAMFDDMIAHAQEVDPHECCGLLAGAHGVVSQHYRITNTVARDARAIAVFEEADVKQLRTLSPSARAEVAYFMDPQEMIAAFKDMRAKNIELAIIYHSHVHSPAYPSMTDIGLAQYPDAAYTIISLEHPTRPDVQTYWIRGGVAQPTDLSVF